MKTFLLFLFAAVPCTIVTASVSNGTVRADLYGRIECLVNKNEYYCNLGYVKNLTSNESCLVTCYKSFSIQPLGNPVDIDNFTYVTPVIESADESHHCQCRHGAAGQEYFDPIVGHWAWFDLGEFMLGTTNFTNNTLQDDLNAESDPPAGIITLFFTLEKHTCYTFYTVKSGKVLDTIPYTEAPTPAPVGWASHSAPTLLAIIVAFIMITL